MKRIKWSWPTPLILCEIARDIGIFRISTNIMDNIGKFTLQVHRLKVNSIILVDEEDGGGMPLEILVRISDSGANEVLIESCFW